MTRKGPVAVVLGEVMVAIWIKVNGLQVYFGGRINRLC